MQILSTLTLVAMVCSAASAASTSSGEELLQSRDVDIARATACAINPGRVGCDPKAKPVVYGRRAPPANQVNNATNNTATNNASVDNNKGAIGNGGNTVKEKDECRIMVGSRSLHKRSEHEHKEHEHKEHDHKSHDQSKRGTPPPKPQGGGGQKGQGGGGKPPAPAGGNKDKAQGGGGKDKGGSGDKPGAQAGGDKKKKPVDPNSLTWKPAKTTTDAKGEVYYESKCYCNCVRKRSEIQIGDIYARAVAAVLEPTCSIVGSDAQKLWKGKCDKSTIEGKPITQVFPQAP